jgi:hypothetical protein
MIEGLKVTISGSEVRELATKRAACHAEKAEQYRNQLEALAGLNVVGTSNRPGDDAKARIIQHTEHAAEMQFIADHVDVNEQYILNSGDLARLGVSYTAW